MTGQVTSRLRVRVQPNAARSEMTGWHGDALRIRTTASPVRGQANRAVTEMLARVLDLPRTDVMVVQGRGSRDKVVEIVSLDRPELLRRLDKMLKPGTAASFPP